MNEIPDMEDEGAGLEDGEDDAAVKIVHPSAYVITDQTVICPDLQQILPSRALDLGPGGEYMRERGGRARGLRRRMDNLDSRIVLAHMTV
jgi:hypothetical protein